MLVAGNGDSIFRRLMRAIGRDDLETDPALAHNDGRVARMRASSMRRSAHGRDSARRDEVLAALDAAERAGRVASIPSPTSSCDPQYLAREMIVESPTSDGQAAEGAGHRAQAQRDAGADRACGAEAGQHNDDLQRGGWPARES